MRSTNIYIRSFKNLTANKPTLKETLILKILILFGLLSLVVFMFWFVEHISIGQPVFFWLLCYALLFRMCRVLHDWYHYFHIKYQVPLATDAKIQTVDVLTTYFPGEPKEMTKNTLLAMKNIKYPHENFLCDEANDQELAEFCEENGIHHIARDSRKDAKAGNINNALQFATGDFCFILDPDHVPHPDLLDKIIPQFADPEIGFVQIVQGYYNTKNSFIAAGAAQQTYQFYGPTMMSMNQLGTTQAIGANCCFRRKALDSIGGHAAGLAEDLHTSMLLHAKGWKSKYIPEILTRGLVPEDYYGYFKQQLKWSKGSFDLLFHVLPKIFRRLTFRQKLHYLLQPQYYLFGVVNFIELITPIFALFFFFIPWKINIVDFFVALTPFISTATLVHIYVQKWVLEEDERGLHFLGGVLRKATWFIYVIGLLFSVLNVRVKYLPTPKENNPGDQLKLVIPNILFGLLSVCAILYGLYHDLTPFSLFMAGFAFLNFSFLFFASFLAMPYFNFMKASSLKKLNLYYLAKHGNRQLWVFRHHIYGLIRKRSIAVAVPLLVLPVLMLMFTGSSLSVVKVNPGTFFMHAYENGEHAGNYNTTIIPVDLNSFHNIDYTEWPNTKSNLFFQLDLTNSDASFFDSFNQGTYDQVINQFCANLRDYGRPFFISIKLAPDLLLNNYIGNRVTTFRIKRTYDRLLDIFNTSNCHNAIWVWQVLKNPNGEYFMPNDDNYDWLLIDLKDSNPSEFRKYLESSEVKFIQNMILDASDVEPEILEHNDIKGMTNYLNVAGLIAKDSKQEANFSYIPGFKKDTNIDPVPYVRYNYDFEEQNEIPWDTIKGVCYQPYDIDILGKAILSKKRLDEDFSRMKSIGANCVRVYSSNIYLRNILAASSRFNLKLMAGCEIPHGLDFYGDRQGVKKLMRKLLNEIQTFRDEDQILFWNLGDDAIGQIEKHFSKPYSQKVVEAYFSFLNDLTWEIYKTDPQLNFVFSVPFSSKNLELLQDHLDLMGPNLFIGLNVYYEHHFEILQQKIKDNPLKSKVVITAFGPDGYWDSKLTEKSILQQPVEMDDFAKARQYVKKWNAYLTDSNLAIPGGFAFRWKDHPHDLTTWMGITSALNTKKAGFYSLRNLWLHRTDSIPFHGNYNLVYTGYRILPNTKSARFHVAKDYKITNSEDDRGHINWVLSKISSDGTILDKFAGQEVSPMIPEELSEGQYRMHVYITDSSNTSISLTAPFAVIRE